MKWEDVLKLFKNQPVIETYMLVQNASDLPNIRVQLSRWVKAGKLVKVRNRFYTLSDEYKTTPSDMEYLAAFTYRPSYISLEYALADYDLIPEMVPNITLVTTRRPHKLRVKNNLFIYKHIAQKLFWGYLSKGEKNFEVFIAEPEKAILDFFYFSYEKLSEAFFEEMRFQNTEVLDLKKLAEYARRFKSKKISNFMKCFCAFAEKQRGYKEL